MQVVEEEAVMVKEVVEKEEEVAVISLAAQAAAQRRLQPTKGSQTPAIGREESDTCPLDYTTTHSVTWLVFPPSLAS